MPLLTVHILAQTSRIAPSPVHVADDLYLPPSIRTKGNESKLRAATRCVVIGCDQRAITSVRQEMAL
jgi:hypothetical protein